jgi:hypothetical protein
MGVDIPYRTTTLVQTFILVNNLLEVMDSYLKFAFAALISIVVGVPLWTAIIAPSEFSPFMILSPKFAVTAALGMSILMLFFWAGNKSQELN